MEVNSGKANLYIQATEAMSETGSTDAVQASAPEILASANQGTADTLEQGYKGSLDEIIGAQLGGQIGDNDTPIVDRSGWNAVNPTHHIPKTLLTGSGNDTVTAWMGRDDLVHVKVNGAEAWSGTLEEFQYLTIDTGDGDDLVKNTVSGATILTGKGNDIVENSGSNSSINTGEGDDKLHNLVWGHANTIDTGEGNDEVHNEGSANVINTGTGNDKLWDDTGTANKYNTGEGIDEVYTDGWGAAFNDFEDPDKG